MKPSDEAVEAAYAVLDRYGRVAHFRCVEDDETAPRHIGDAGLCLQRRHELAKVREVVEAAYEVTVAEHLTIGPQSWTVAD